ncbi:MAG TPA: FAD binding domain-containing protein, partial [Thermoanaerobaculia bacterium]|nr:FAD binding domain-containing protein [Thermoanaerobaculia bacterium]
MLRLPPFQLVQPRTLPEAAAALSGEGAANGELVRLVAGGTDLWPNMKRRHQKARAVVSLMGIPGLRGVDANGEVRIGATTILEDLVRHEAVRSRYPAFARAVASISSPPLREMGTIGGNVCVDTRCTYYNQTEEWRRSIGYCMKAEGEICWVATSSPRCLAHTASDSAPMLCALGARVRLTSQEG